MNSLDSSLGSILALDNAFIRSSTSPGLARYFQELLQKTSHIKLITYLASAIHSGALPPTVVHIFLSICKEPDAISYALRQNHSVLARRIAVNHFIRKCRTSAFEAMWNAVGGVQGLLRLMSLMSVYEVDLLCRGIGKCTSMKHPIHSRQLCFSNLLGSLRNTNDQSISDLRNLDLRPLGSYYNKILPACLPDLVLQEASKGIKLSGTVCRTDVEDYQHKFLTIIFSPTTGHRITPYKFVLEGSAAAFSLDVLRRLSITPSQLKINAENLFEDLVRPLARRLNNRKGSELLRIELYRLLIKCINTEPIIANALDFPTISYAIRAWNHAGTRRDTMEDFLKTLLRHMTEEHQWTLDRIAEELRHTRPRLRYPLLQFLFRNARPFKVNISLASHEELRSLGDAWPPRLFYLLPSRISFELFQFLKKAHPHGKFVTADETGDIEAVTRDVDPDGKHFSDPYILQSLLHLRYRGNWPLGITWLIEIDEVLQERKDNAVTATSAEERANWIHATVLLSIASGSLQLYEEIIAWAMQFNNEALIVKRLLSSNTLYTKSGLSLLSGISISIAYDDNPLMKLEENVKQAHRIVMKYMEMVSKGHRESSIAMHDNYNLCNLGPLPSKIIWRRVELLDSFQDATGLSDDEIYNLVWKPSIDLLLEFERFNLEEGRGRLYSRFLRGPLMGQALSDSPKAHFCKFLDELAKSRDRFWQDYRSRIHPEIANVGAPWPRGLPIQRLIPAMPSAWKNMPYMESRAKAILFAPSEVLLDRLPSNRGMRTIIGPFVDSFSFALRVFASAVDNGPERETRIRQKHFFDLTPGIALPDSIVALFRISDLELPTQNNSRTLVDWNPSQTFVHYSPVPHAVQHIKKSAQSCLDCMLRTNKAWRSWRSDTVHSFFETFKLQWIYVEKAPSIWDSRYSLKDLTVSKKDALVAVAIEVLNKKYGMDYSVFTQPFPSLEDIRFPALYLGKEFLEGYGRVVTLDSMLQILDYALSTIPPKLLQKLARSMWKRLDGERSSNDEVLIAFLEIVKRLSQGDFPQVACEFIRLAILKYQYEGPFHRYLLGAEFLSRLKQYEAKDLSHDLSHAIRNHLRLEQRTVKSRARKSKPPAPRLIEVITVNSAARLLCMNKYIHPGFAYEPLGHLLESSTDENIRVAVLENLLRFNSAVNNQYLQLKIIDILEEHAVPIAASINESWPPTEAEWRKAEAT
ncbi:hypothetical protein K449DRAFT_465672 [Hypoxylon sp. EC38]|nr:hypothetical protein K449DRAFT_465672 [Hypoxylon sp. EC38]